jgi:hypothetical protein
MSDAERLTSEVKTYVTKATKDELEAIAKERGEGVKTTQVVRDAIREFLERHRSSRKKK